MMRSGFLQAVIMSSAVRYLFYHNMYFLQIVSGGGKWLKTLQFSKARFLFFQIAFFPPSNSPNHQFTKETS